MVFLLYAKQNSLHAQHAHNFVLCALKLHLAPCCRGLTQREYGVEFSSFKVTALKTVEE